MKVICKECGKEFEKALSAIKRTRNNFCCTSCAGKYNGRKRRGPYKNRNPLYEQARQLRLEGYGYRTIGRKVGISPATIRHWVKDISVDLAIAHKISAEYFKAPYKPLNELRTNPARRNYLIRARGRRCEYCSLTHWLNQFIPLELHHIDGDKKNNREENLELVCPNCHALTGTYKGKNIAGQKTGMGC